MTIKSHMSLIKGQIGPDWSELLAFSSFPTMFSKPLCFRIVKSGLFCKELNSLFLRVDKRADLF